MGSSEGAGHRQQKRAVFAPQGGVEIAYKIVGFDFAAEGLELFGVDADFRIQVEDEQLFALAITEHVHESVIAVDELASGIGDVNALLHLLKEQTISLFRGTTVRDVADDVNGAFLRTALLGVRRCRDHGIAAEAGVRALGELFVASHGDVGPTTPLAKLQATHISPTAHTPPSRPPP